MAGLLAGLLAGVFALVVAEPSLESAIALEAARQAEDGIAGDADGLARSTQHLGLVIGLTAFGAAVGVGFGVAAAWAAGRLSGGPWRRSVTLGCVLVAGVVLLPALGAPPNPPGAGDPATVGARSATYLFLAVAGPVMAGLAWSAARWAVGRGIAAPAAQAAATVGAVVVAALLLGVVRTPDVVGDLPADLLWAFRLSAVGTQVVLWGGLAAIHGLLMSAREEVTLPPAQQAATAA